MYWFRPSILHTIPLAILFLGLWFGGWLLATHVLRVRGRERLAVGLATGLVLFTVLSNALAYLMGSTWAFVSAALVVLGVGLFSAWDSKKPWFHLSDLQAWPQVLAFFIIGMVFTLILRGVSIWDDYNNLPIVSTMAAGNLPPRYYLDPSLPFSFHYGLHVFAASMVSVGSFTPWSAWDITRGFTTALAIVLAWLWFRRITGSVLSAYFGSALLTFGGGTLWLLSLLPEKVLAWLSANTPLANSALDSGPNLVANLSRPFLFGGSPSFPMPFSFLGGIFPPVTVNWTATSSLYLICIFLLLMETGRKRLSWLSILVSSLILSLIALNAEHIYILLVAGISLMVIFSGIRTWRTKNAKFRLNWMILVVVISLVITLLQGGVISELVRNFITRKGAGPVNGLGTAGFLFQWPPAIVSDYFKPLSVFNPAQLIVGLADIGPAVLLIPIIVYWIWKFGKRDHVVEAGLGLAGLIGVILPLFIHYGVERDTSRFTGFGLQTFLIVSVPALAFSLKHGKAKLQGLVIWGFGLSIISGIVIFAVLFTAITTPQLTYFIDSLDARMSYLGWNRLESGSQVLDRIPYRAVTIYGRFTHSSPASGPVDFSTYPEWQALIDNPDPGAVARSGYDYIYMDNTWWQQLAPIQQDALNQSCVQVAQETGDENSGLWRRLLNVSKCK